MRASDVPDSLASRTCPDFGEPALVAPPTRRQAAIVSTAGLMHRGDTPFGFGAADYRIIDAEREDDLVMTHISTNFDRSGFVQDNEVVFPLQRLRSACERGLISACSRLHYSFMGATDPTAMLPAADQLVRAMRGDGTNVVLLVPV